MSRLTSPVLALCLAGCSCGAGGGGSAGPPDLMDDMRFAQEAAPDYEVQHNRCVPGALPEGSRISLPADEAPHQEPSEWWYWTGHLQADDGRWFGFEEVFFLAKRDGIWGQMAHHALTDVEAGAFHYVSKLDLGRPEEKVGAFALSVPPLSARGGTGRDTLHGEVDDLVLDLELTDTKRPVLQHGDGHLVYPFGGFTYYFSRGRMAAEGTLRLGDETLAVRGEAWFDHQWGDLAAVTDVGWDWLAIQLEDRRELMLFSVRVEGGERIAGGSLTDADCASRELHAGDFEVEPTGQWESPHSGCTYPAGWTVRLDDEVLAVTPVLADQELQVPELGMSYWEGAATVAGTSAGRAYVELTGYCD